MSAAWHQELVSAAVAKFSEVDAAAGKPLVIVLRMTSRSSSVYHGNGSAAENRCFLKKKKKKKNWRVGGDLLSFPKRSGDTINLSPTSVQWVVIYLGRTK